jgi:3-oxoacyl-[acyl-carrier protein] reductase
MDLGLRDRAFVVTGGSRGLGRAAAEALVSEGARVLISSRNPDKVRSAADEIGAVGVAADNADPGTAELLAEGVLQHYGRIDGALISVGGPPPGPAMKLTDEQWRSAFDSVFLGAVRLAQAVAARLGEGGSILFVLSSSVRSPIPGLAISNGLRPGLAMVAKTLADELGPQGIRVNGILPGRIDTERARELDAAKGDPEDVRRRSAQSIPLGRYGTAEEFGRVAAFLLSPAAAFVSGAMVPVDGGALRAL